MNCRRAGRARSARFSFLEEMAQTAALRQALRVLCLGSFVTVFGACSHSSTGTHTANPPSPSLQSLSDRERESVLTHDLLGLGDDVSAEEANRLAVTALASARALAVEYQARRPAWLHNIKVNWGLRQRGLCYEWAEDLHAALEREQFQTLQLHRAVAKFNTRREHSGLVITARGRDFSGGIVLDAWRWSGQLAWSRVHRDKYPWKPFFPEMLEPGPLLRDQ